MSTTYDVQDGSPGRPLGIAAAVVSLRRGELAVLPTDTVYGIACDAFSPHAVNRLLQAKGRGRDMPVPVLVGSLRTLEGLADEVSPLARQLTEALWPGALTLVVRAAPSLSWDLGESRGTVAVRMPLQAVTLEVLAQTGPLAVSSANRSGLPAATTQAHAERQLGDLVETYLDAGPSGDTTGSTIVDLTGQRPRLLRLGPVSLDVLREYAPDLLVEP